MNCFNGLKNYIKVNEVIFLASDPQINWYAEEGQTFDSDQVARTHQICMCTKQLPFSKNLVSLLNENGIYINQLFNFENFFTDRS